MPSRRAYLTAVAAVGLAGCVGAPSETTAGSSADTTDDAPSDTATPTDAAPRPAVDIVAAAVQYSFRHVEQVDWNAVRPATGQYVFVTVDTGGETPVPGREAFTLVADGEAHDPVEIRDILPSGIGVPEGPYVPEERGTCGWLVFDVPAQLDALPSLRVETDGRAGEWRLDVERALAPPPAWDWSASVPETVSRGETFDISVTAENVGDGPGTFRGAVNFSYPLYQPKGFELALAPGESATATVPAKSGTAESGRTLEYDVRTAAGRTTVETTVEGDSTESTG
jgi:hypothetical protein